MPKIQLIGETYEARSPNVSIQTCVNLVPEKADSGKDKFFYYNSPGLSLWKAVTGHTTPPRGMIVFDDKLWVVISDRVFTYSEAANGTITEAEISTSNASHKLATTSGTVSIAVGKNQLAIVDGTDRFYVYDKTDTVSGLQVITTWADASDLTMRPTQITYMDGYFICNNTHSAPSELSLVNPNLVYQSAEENALSWAKTSSDAVSRDPDPVKAVISDHGELFFLGDYSTEVWFNAGSTTFSFEPIRAAAIPWGISAPFSLAAMNESIVWLARKKNGEALVISLDGYKPVVISTAAIEYQIHQYTIETIQSAFAYTYLDEGHEFYVLTFPGQTTFVYDAATKLWHERQSYTGSAYTRHRSGCYAFYHGKHLVGDYENGEILYMSTSVYTEYDSNTTRNILRERRTPFIYKDDKPLFHSRIYLDLQTGSGSNSIVNLRWTDDNGTTWTTNSARNVSSSNAKQIVEWFRLGSSRSRVYEISTTNAVPITWISGYLDYVEGARS